MNRTMLTMAMAGLYAAGVVATVEPEVAVDAPRGEVIEVRARRQGKGASLRRLDDPAPRPKTKSSSLKRMLAWKGRK